MPYKLLLADDSLTIQKVVELVLANENFDIKTVNDGEAAQQVMESFSPDIVLADIDMPKLNGYEFCREIKSTRSFAHIPVILLAGAFEPFDEEQAKAVSADDFIIKPFESQELISKVKGLLAAVSKPSAPVVEAIPEAIEEPLPETELPADMAMMLEDLPASGSSASADDNISWDDAFQEASGEKKEEELPSVEEPPAVAAEEPLGFGDELNLALMEEEAPAVLEQVESAAEAEDISFPAGLALDEEIVAEPPRMPDIDDVVADERTREVGRLASEDVAAALQDSVGRAVSEIAPAVVERVTRELVSELLGSLRGEIETTIRRVVPEVAEAIIKKEIDKITSGL